MMFKRKQDVLPTVGPSHGSESASVPTIVRPSLPRSSTPGLVTNSNPGSGAGTPRDAPVHLFGSQSPNSQPSTPQARSVIQQLRDRIRGGSNDSGKSASSLPSLSSAPNLQALPKNTASSPLPSSNVTNPRSPAMFMQSLQHATAVAPSPRSSSRFRTSGVDDGTSSFTGGSAFGGTAPPLTSANSGILAPSALVPSANASAAMMPKSRFRGSLETSDDGSNNSFTPTSLRQALGEGVSSVPPPPLSTAASRKIALVQRPSESPRSVAPPPVRPQVQPSGPRKSMALKDKEAELRAEAEAAKKAAAEPRWTNDAPGKRFTMLRGSKIVKESELVLLKNIYEDAQTRSSDGAATVDAFKTVLGTYTASQRASGALGYKFLQSIVTVLGQKKSHTEPLSFPEVLACIYTRATPEELAFLESSVEAFVAQYNSTEGMKCVKLTPAEVKMARDIFLRLDTEKANFISYNQLVDRIMAAFSYLDENRLARQIRQTLPRNYRAIDVNAFLTFLSVHLASDPKIILSEFSTFLHGHEVIAGKYIRKEEDLSDDQIKSQLNGIRPQGTTIGRLISKHRRSIF